MAKLLETLSARLSREHKEALAQNYSADYETWLEDKVDQLEDRLVWRHELEDKLIARRPCWSASDITEIIEITPEMSRGEGEFYTEWFQCPNCDDDFIASRFNYCPNCGRSLRHKESE